MIQSLLCSFDGSSLFTNVPLDETIKICSEPLYDEYNSQPVIPKNVFVELMKSAKSSVEFSFNNTMYKQTDGVAMGSPLGSALANIFVGYYEEKLFSQTQKPPTYFRYVGHTFAIFDHKAGADKFLTQLNCLHSSLKFTFEKKKGKCLPFLDVYVEGTDVGFETSRHGHCKFKLNSATANPQVCDRFAVTFRTSANLDRNIYCHFAFVMTLFIFGGQIILPTTRR